MEEVRTAHLAVGYEKSMNRDVNQADKSRYTEQVSGGVLTTAISEEGRGSADT